MQTYFAIVAIGRCGSTYLERLLDSHPQITCLSEVFNQSGAYPVGSERDAAAFIKSRLFGEARGVLGFKFPWQNRQENPGVLGAIRAMDFRLIHLRRRNRLDQYLSLALAQHNNVWGAQGAYPEQTIALDPDLMVNYFQVWNEIDEQYQAICR